MSEGRGENASAFCHRFFVVIHQICDTIKYKYWEEKLYDYLYL